jgi:hypothetical protein
MKKVFFFLLPALFFLSCSKEKVDSSSFTGVWEYENFSGYPFNNNYQPPGNGRIIVLSANGNFERRQHDTVLFKGRYFLKKQKDCYEEEKKIHFTTSDTLFHWDQYIHIDMEGKLKLSTPNCYQDGGTVTYRKIGG